MDALSTKPLGDSHTALNIKEWIKNILSDFGIVMTKVMPVTTDNSAL